MPSDLLNRKISRHFDLIDTNGDGEITQADFDLVVTRLSEEFGEAADSPKRRALSDAYQALWGGMQQSLDTDRDGAISREEYVAGLGADAPAGYRQYVQPVAKAIIRLCDTNGDGKLDGAELLKVHRALSMDSGSHDEAMAKLDRDGDGFISEQELTVAIEEFFSSEDPEAAGNWLFGRV
ncbi:EF-hand domain-containing protein [Streptomyces formicae]